MKLFTSNPQYSHITLNPRAEEEKKEWWNFRSKNVRKMFSFILVVGIVLWMMESLKVSQSE